MKIAFLASFAAVSASAKDHLVFFLLAGRLKNGRVLVPQHSGWGIFHSSCIAKRGGNSVGQCHLPIFCQPKKKAALPLKGRAPILPLRRNAGGPCDVNFFSDPSKSPQKFQEVAALA